MSDKRDECKGGLTWGIVLIAIGVIFLLSNWGIIPDFWESWPIILIVIGVVLIVAAKRKKKEEGKSPDQKTEQISPPPGQKE